MEVFLPSSGRHVTFRVHIAFLEEGLEDDVVVLRLAHLV